MSKGLNEFQREVLAEAERVTPKPKAAAKQAQRATAVKQEPAPQEPESDLDGLRRSADHIIQHPSILDLFAQELSQDIAGEATNAKLLYLVGTSRLFTKTMHAAIKGTSAGGKSELRKRVLDYFPPESVISFTSLSEKALLYYDGSFANKILSMGEANGTEEQSFQDYLLRELMSEGRLRHMTLQKIGNEVVPVTIDKEGPVSFLVTTTKNKLHAENETRMLSLEIDDSEKQTKNVLGKVAQVEGLNHATAQVDRKPWQGFQRWLELGERRVVLPFAAAMVDLIPPAAVRLRRDVGQVFRAIKAHALLHREQRARDATGQIVADIERDYEPVRKLMNAIIAEGSGVAVNAAMTETIDAVIAATASLGETEGASAQDIAQALKLDKSAARRRLLAARDEGFVVNLEQRRGMPGKYRATGQKVEPVNILPLAADLADKHSLSDTPQKPVPPCHLEENDDILLRDNGGKAGGKPVDRGAAGGSGGNPVARPFATVKPLDANADSVPVARWQCFSGGTEGEKGDDDLTIPKSLDRRGEVCAQCGMPGGLECFYGDAPVRLHSECQRAWMAGFESSRSRIMAGSSSQ